MERLVQVDRTTLLCQLIGGGIDAGGGTVLASGPHRQGVAIAAEGDLVTEVIIRPGIGGLDGKPGSESSCF